MNARDVLANQVEKVGGDVHELRDKLNGAQFAFTAGLVRAAEEALLLAMTGLKDPAVPENEL